MAAKVTMKDIRDAVEAARTIPAEFENQVALPADLVDRLLNQVKTLERENAELRALIKQMKRVGAMLANCAFNLSQREPGEFGPRDIDTLDESRKAWDEALNEPPRRPHD